MSVSTWLHCLLLVIVSGSCCQALLIGTVPLQTLLRTSVLSSETAQSLECIYSASRDGWDARVFHTRCDYNPPVPSLVLAKAKGAKQIFGCVNPLGWQSRDDYRDSNKIFIFRADGQNVQFSTKISGGPALYDFGDRGVWLSEALDIPLNGKYCPKKKCRSALSSSYSALTPAISGVNGLFNGLDAELVELEVYTSKSLLRSSKPMTGGEAGPDGRNEDQREESIFFKLEKFLFGS